MTNPFDYNDAGVDPPELLAAQLVWKPEHDLPPGSVILGDLRLYRAGPGKVEASAIHNAMSINELEFAEWLIRVGQQLALEAKRGT